MPGTNPSHQSPIQSLSLFIRALCLPCSISWFTRSSSCFRAASSGSFPTRPSGCYHMRTLNSFSPDLRRKETHSCWSLAGVQGSWCPMSCHDELTWGVSFSRSRSPRSAVLFSHEEGVKDLRKKNHWVLYSADDGPYDKPIQPNDPPGSPTKLCFR